MTISITIRRALYFVIVIAMGVSACSDDGSPEKATRAFVRAVQEGNGEKVFSLLAPQSQELLQKLAATASVHTGNKKQFKTEEMVQLNLDPSSKRLGAIEVIREAADQAEVRLNSDDGKYHEVLKLVRIEGKWRVLLQAPPS